MFLLCMSQLTGLVCGFFFVFDGASCASFCLSGVRTHKRGKERGAKILSLSFMVWEGISGLWKRSKIPLDEPSK